MTNNIKSHDYETNENTREAQRSGNIWAIVLAVAMAFCLFGVTALTGCSNDGDSATKTVAEDGQTKTREIGAGTDIVAGGIAERVGQFVDANGGEKVSVTIEVIIQQASNEITYTEGPDILDVLVPVYATNPDGDGVVEICESDPASMDYATGRVAAMVNGELKTNGYVVEVGAVDNELIVSKAM